ncbi:MAG TPA: hypothetical protein PK916_08950 [Bacteroidota bacterium]|nr:hypothetical protein [Bacteroidota bacterium]
MRFLFIPSWRWLGFVAVLLFMPMLAVFAQESVIPEQSLIGKLAEQFLPLLIPVITPVIVGLLKSVLSRFLESVDKKLLRVLVIIIAGVLVIVGDLSNLFMLSEIWWVKGIVAVILGAAAIGCYEVVKPYLPSYALSHEPRTTLK